MITIPNLIEPFLVILMGCITWQATARVPHCAGRVEWLSGTLLAGFGIILELTAQSNGIQGIGFAALSLGLAVNCMALQLFMQYRKEISIVILSGLLLIHAIAILVFSADLQLVFRALLMAVQLAWFVRILVKMESHRVMAGFGTFVAVFLVTILFLCIRSLVGIVHLLLPKLIPAEPATISYLTTTLAALSTVSSVVLFLAVLMQKHSDSFRFSDERDELTGTYNRRSLDIRLADMPLHNTLYSIAMIDIDNFDSVNNRFGHETGDQVLKLFTDHISQSIRNGDYFARYGSEEFCLIMENTSVSVASRVVDRIRQQFSELAIVVNGNEEKFSFSAGICDNAGEFFEAEDILRESEKALNKAKQQGRNRVVAVE